MGCKTRVLEFSAASEIAEAFERLAQRQGRTKSQLFREMVETYRAGLEEEEFFRLQRKMARKAQRKGIFSEKEVEKLVFQAR